MTHVLIEIPDEQLLSLVLEAQRGEVAVDSLIEAVFQWGMNVYNGDVSISQRIDTGDNERGTQLSSSFVFILLRISVQLIMVLHH